MSREPVEDDVPGDEDEFLESESEGAEDVEEIEKVAKPSAPVNDEHGRGSRRSVEDYLERKRLREELGSVFEDDDDLNNLDLPDDED